MVIIDELVRMLRKYDDDIPVYWGVDGLPCWKTTQNATLNDFPVRLEYYKDKEGNECQYLYFAGFDDYKKGVYDGAWAAKFNVPAWLRWMFFK